MKTVLLNLRNLKFHIGLSFLTVLPHNELAFIARYGSSGLVGTADDLFEVFQVHLLGASSDDNGHVFLSHVLCFSCQNIICQKIGNPDI